MIPADGRWLVLASSLLLGCTSDAAKSPSGSGGASVATNAGGTTSATGGTRAGGDTSTAQNRGGSTGAGGVAVPGSGGASGADAAQAGTSGSGGMPNTGSGPDGGGTHASGGGAGASGKVGAGGSANSGGTGAATSTGGATRTGGTGGDATPDGGAGLGAAFPFPQNVKGSHCVLPTSYDNEKVRTAYQQWKEATITSDGAGTFQRVKKPDSGTVIGSSVSEGIGYGMILAVYLNDQSLFDNLWKYEQSHLDDNGLMNWEIGPDGKTTSGGSGAASDGDEDMAWALVMADKQWGGKGSLADTYLATAQKLIDLIWTYEVDQSRGYMLKPGDQWGNVDITNPSYFAPAYYRVFGQVTGKASDWNKVIAGNYDILEKSLNATSGNASNGLVPAWCNSSGTPVEAFSGSPKYFQNDSTRMPFRVGQDFCYFAEPRAKSYLDKITSFYVGVGVSKIVDGYDLNGTPHPDKATSGAQAASFVGPAGVGAMSDAKYQSFLDGAYAAVATLKLTAGTIYYQKSWTALSLLMMTGNLVDFTHR